MHQVTFNQKLENYVNSLNKKAGYSEYSTLFKILKNGGLITTNESELMPCPDLCVYVQRFGYWFPIEVYIN